jgi:hypothetical protein
LKQGKEVRDPQDYAQKSKSSSSSGSSDFSGSHPLKIAVSTPDAPEGSSAPVEPEILVTAPDELQSSTLAPEGHEIPVSAPSSPKPVPSSEVFVPTLEVPAVSAPEALETPVSISAPEEYSVTKADEAPVYIPIDKTTTLLKGMAICQEQRIILNVGGKSFQTCAPRFHLNRNLGFLYWPLENLP